jgi:hypothetical protein
MQPDRGRRTVICLATLGAGGVLLPAAAQPARPAAARARATSQSNDLRLLQTYRASHALVIGASRYRAGWQSLPGVAEDTLAVAALLAEHGFQVDTVADPTRDQLDLALRRFVERHGQQPDHRLVVYFAGHGHTVKAHGSRLGYLVPVDAPRPAENLAAFKAAAYPMDQLEGLARQIESRHVLFILDSCFAGTVFRLRSRSTPESITEKTSWPVRSFITAGDEFQAVADQSLFRRTLEKGLRGSADLNGDGFITGSELGSYLEDAVTDYTRRTQTPRWGKIRDPALDRGDIVFLSPRAARTGPREVAAAPATSPMRGESAPAGGALLPRLDGAAFYVPRMNLTVLADANLPRRLPLGIPDIDEEGRMPLDRALAWVAALNAARHLGYGDWRLPAAGPVHGMTHRFNAAPGDAHTGHNGSNDLGYNITAPSTPGENVSASELPFLHHQVLGNRSAKDTTGQPQDLSRNRFEPLLNIGSGPYWSSQRYGGSGGLAFNFRDGSQYAYEASTPERPGAGFRFNLMVVRSGDSRQTVAP